MKAHVSLHQHDGLLNPSDGGDDYLQYHDELQPLLNANANHR